LRYGNAHNIITIIIIIIIIRIIISMVAMSGDLLMFSVPTTKTWTSSHYDICF